MIDSLSSSLPAVPARLDVASLVRPADAGLEPSTTDARFAVPSAAGESMGGDPTRAGPPGASSVVEGLQRPFDAIESMRTQMRDLLSEIKSQDLSSLTDDQRAQVNLKNNFRVLELQLGMGELSFQVELISKVAEQGTSGTRQVLQTQT